MDRHVVDGNEFNTPPITSLRQAYRCRAFWFGLASISFWSAVTRLAPNANSYFDAEDALAYAINVRGRHFEFFDAAGSGWQLLCTFVQAALPSGSEGTAAGKLIAGVAGSATPAILYITLVLATNRVLLPLAISFFYSVAFCPWWYSLQPDKYVPQIALLAIALALVITRRQRPSLGFLSLLGVVYFCAIVIHTDSGLICLSIFPMLFRDQREQGAATAFSHGLISAGVMFAALAVYFSWFLYFFVKPGSVSGGLHWMMSYMVVAGDPTGWGNWSPRSVALAFVGIARSVFTTEFAFGISSIAKRVSEIFPDKILIEEQWLGSLFPSWLLKVGLAVLAASVVSVCGVLVLGVFGFIQIIVRHRTANWHAIASILCYLVPATVFFDWWEPTNNEFWIAPWYGVALLLGIVLATMPSRAGTFGVLVASFLLAALNGGFGVYPRLDARSDYWFLRQAAFAQILKPSDIVVENGFMADNYIEYLSHAHVIRADDRGTTPESISAKIKQLLHDHPEVHSVYLSDLVTEMDEQLRRQLPQENKAVLESFVKSLPPPTEWILLEGGRRIAKYNADAMR